MRCSVLCPHLSIEGEVEVVAIVAVTTSIAIDGVE